MSPQDPSRAVWLAAGIRLDIDRLTESAERADELKLPEIASQFRDLALEMAKLYEQLIKLASPTSGRKQVPHSSLQEDLPF